MGALSHITIGMRQDPLVNTIAPDVGFYGMGFIIPSGLGLISYHNWDTVGGSDMMILFYL